MILLHFAVFWPFLRHIDAHCVITAHLLLLLAGLPSAQAQGARCFPTGSGWYYWLPDNGMLPGGSIPLFDNNQCEPPSEGSSDNGKYGSVSASSRESAAELCNRMNGVSNSYARPKGGGSLWSCYVDSSSGGGKAGSGSSGGGGVAPKQHGYERPLTGVQVAAELGMNSGIHFKRLEAFHVGIQSVVDRGVLDVVDVWGNANQYFEVCFPQSGAVVFLDAATSPRTVIEISNFTKDGYTCAAMNRAGMMVLVRQSAQASTASANAAIAQSFIDATTDPISSAIALEDCQVSSIHNLNLRAEPWADKLDVLRKNTRVAAIARTESWFKVTLEQADADEIEGWIAAWLSAGEGACDWAPLDEEEDSPALASSQLVPSDEHLSLT